MVQGKTIDDACLFDSSPLSTFRVLREKLHSGLSGPWWQGYKNPEVDSLIDQAARTIDEAQRRSIYRRVYSKISDDAPWIFLYSPNFFWGVGKRAHGSKIEMDGVIRV
jgi:peptide/nickel transport system substrate-binding protein